MQCQLTWQVQYCAWSELINQILYFNKTFSRRDLISWLTGITFNSFLCILYFTFLFYAFPQIYWIDFKHICLILGLLKLWWGKLTSRGSPGFLPNIPKMGKHQKYGSWHYLTKTQLHLVWWTKNQGWQSHLTEGMFQESGDSFPPCYLLGSKLEFEWF